MGKRPVTNDEKSKIREEFRRKLQSSEPGTSISNIVVEDETDDEGEVGVVGYFKFKTIEMSPTFDPHTDLKKT